MQIGTSTASWTVRSIALSSSGSSTSGIPALMSSMSAPASTCASASTVTVERSPPRSSSANILRPVGLIRSPMTQNGCPAPIVTLLRPRPKHCIHGSLFLVWWDPQPRAQLRDAGVLAERDEVQAGDAGLRERVGGQLVGDARSTRPRRRRPARRGRTVGRRDVDPRARWSPRTACRRRCAGCRSRESARCARLRPLSTAPRMNRSSSSGR